jgi:hypothetical protein
VTTLFPTVSEELSLDRERDIASMVLALRKFSASLIFTLNYEISDMEDYFRRKGETPPQSELDRVERTKALLDESSKALELLTGER